MAYQKYKDIPYRREPQGGRDHIQHIENGLIGVVDAVADVPPRVEAVETAVADIAPRIEVAEKAPARVSAYRHGVRANTGTPQNAALHAAFAEAEAIGGGAQVELPPGTITIEGTLSLSGYSSGMVGTGATTTASGYPPMNGTVFRAVSQTGPVLDFRGFRGPSGQVGRVLFSDFGVEGDGTVGADKKGIHLEALGSGVDFQRIIIAKTGGVGLHVKDDYFCDFYGVVVADPVDCAATDTPYVLLEGANGNRFYGLGFRSSNHNHAVADVGPSGALRCIGSAYHFHQTAFYGMWFENQHVPANGTLIETTANHIVFSDTQFYDIRRVEGAAGTSHVRFRPANVADWGGMVWRGPVPGDGANGGAATLVERGIEVYQDGAHITGTAMYAGKNIYLAPGVKYVYALLGGGHYANSAKFINESGNETNTLIDAMRGIWRLGAQSASTASLTMAGGLELLTKHEVGAASSGNSTINMSTGLNIREYNLTGNLTITGVTYSGTPGRELTLIFRQDATGGHAVTWASAFRFAGGAAPVIGTAPNAVSVMRFMYTSTGHWQEISRSIGAMA